jgi:hypothetical protein
LHFEAKNSSVILSGTFLPDTGTDILEGKTRARVYSERGLHAETIVSEGGSFTLSLTDIFVGRTPFILVFVTFAASSSVNQVALLDSANKPPKRRLATEGVALFGASIPLRSARVSPS